MKKTIQRELIIKRLQVIVDDLKGRSETANSLSNQVGSGFPQEYYIEAHGRSLAFQWSAEEIERLMNDLSK